MIYINLDNDTILVNGRVADMRTLQYVSDAAVVEKMSQDLNAYLILEDVGLTSQGIGALASWAGKMINWDWSKVLEYIKKFLPDSIEGWVHLGVDVISLILDIIGPFTAGIGNAASVVIDIIHGLYYIGASQNWPGFPDRRDKEFEYLLCGMITLGFAALPIGGNAGSIGFKTFLKNNPIGKLGVVKFMEKLLTSSIGKSIIKVFEWIIKNVGKLGKFFYNLFAKMTKVPLIGGIFKFFGNVLKNAIAKISNSLDNLLIKLFKKPGMKEVFEKNSKELGEHFSKVLAEHEGAKTTVKAAAETGKIASKEVLKTLPGYKAIVGKLKMIVTQIITDKVDLTKGINQAWALLAGQLPDKDTQLEKLKEVGLPVDKYDDWYLKYAFFIDDSDREDKELSKEDVVNIQQYLNQYTDVLEIKEPLEESGKIDADTILATRLLFQYLIDQDTTDLSDEEKESATELIAHCEEGLKELDKLDKGFFSSLKDKIVPTSESYLVDFKNFK